MMKKFLAVAMMAVLLVGALASCANNLGDPDAIGDYVPEKTYWVDAAGNTFHFQEAEGETAILTKYNGKATRDDKVVIPATFNGRTVTAIGDEAFYNLASIVSVDIPATVTEIGKFAFAGCTSIETIDLPAGLLKINESAFTGCTSLTTVNWGNKNDAEGAEVVLETIGENAFRGCTSLANISLPETLTTIDKAAFWGCVALTELTVPASVTAIGDLAYYNCTGLTSIKLHDGLTAEGLGKFIFTTETSTLKDKIDLTVITEGTDVWTYVENIAEPTVETDTENAAQAEE